MKNKKIDKLWTTGYIHGYTTNWIQTYTENSVIEKSSRQNIHRQNDLLLSHPRIEGHQKFLLPKRGHRNGVS